ncbi:hypothetical protein AcW1_009756 [Taiwanofungus camphoratus]|nr:hypothetical protein AcW1_009756 [Antrodia cinnamomea]
MQHSSFPRASVLVLGSNSVQSLVPSTLISQAEALLENHRIEDVVDLADQQRKKLQAMMTVDEHEADELRYVYQRLGFQCLSETLFDDAGKHFFNGELDPRVLISYYPDLPGKLLNGSDTVEVFAGVEEHMPMEGSINDIIRNYSPHLAPNTRTASPTVELRSILTLAAKDMLETYLRKWRTKCRLEGLATSLPLEIIVDTVLAKLFVAHEKVTELHALIGEPNHILLSEIESLLMESRRYYALCTLYHQHSEDSKLLEAWSKLVDGEWVDKDVQDPLSRIFSLLSEKRDRMLIQQWGVWLTKHDHERALKLLTSLGSGKRKVEDDRALLQQLQDANPTAASQFLEHLVLQKRILDPNLHMQLAMVCVDQLLSCLADEPTSKLWRAKVASYSSGRSDASFLSYFASTTPDSEPKRVRLKTVLFLQGSTLYDPQIIRERLANHEKILRLELAIVDGKLGQHRSALSSLVHDLRDASSAEVYCTLGGEVIPAKTAQSLGERFDLQSWASLLVLPAGKTKPSAVPMSRLVTVDPELKKSLIKILLEVYMSGGEVTADRTARFLDAQAMNLDVMDVISLIPPEWPLRILSTFLARSFRRTLHAKHEGQIVKAISAGENLAVAERTWLVLREQGAIIEEAVDDGEDDGAALDNEKLNEKGLAASFDEKVSLRGYDLAAESVEQGSDAVDIGVAGAKEQLTDSDPGSEVQIGT